MTEKVNNWLVGGTLIYKKWLLTKRNLKIFNKYSYNVTTNGRVKVFKGSFHSLSIYLTLNLFQTLLRITSSVPEIVNICFVLINDKFFKIIELNSLCKS
jgi:hypothetical protein